MPPTGVRSGHGLLTTKLRAGPLRRERGPGAGARTAARPRSAAETRPAFQVRCWLAEEQAHRPATASTMFSLMRRAHDARLWGDGGAGGVWKSVLAPSAQLSEKEALGVVFTEGRRYPRMSPFPGRRATGRVLGTS